LTAVDDRGPAITTFDGDPRYEFLSNFHPCPVVLDGLEYRTVEHAYQAAKTLDGAERDHVRSASTPAEAKARGQQVTVRPDWNDIKIDVMRALLRQKFAAGPLRDRLLATRPSALIEGNTWDDRFWGVCDGEGENWLGRLLMEIRDH
jgi:N-glycosidase YbiA